MDADAGVSDDTGEEPVACRNLIVAPQSVLLDSIDGGPTSQSVTLINDCTEETEAPINISNVILADETGAFTIAARSSVRICLWRECIH